MSSATTQDLPLVVRLLLEGGKLTEEQLEHVRKARNEGHGTIEEALVLKIDAFNFSIEALRFPRLRATLRFTPFEHVYVNAGMDDILNTQNRNELTNRLISGRDFFVGAGVYFTDADIKSLLPVIPTP